jgi:DNA helicase-2/ATP-dependent DNA helicase PcrA
VDWKTSRTETADPWQLAIYRLAWAEMHSIPVDSVDAIFYYVRADRIVRPDRLPGRAELEQLLLNEPGVGHMRTARTGLERRFAVPPGLDHA